MKLAAAQAIASVIKDNELHEDYIVPGVFNQAIAPSVAKAVVEAANRTGVARKYKESLIPIPDEQIEA